MTISAVIDALPDNAINADATNDAKRMNGTKLSVELYPVPVSYARFVSHIIASSNCPLRITGTNNTSAVTAIAQMYCAVYLIDCD